MYHYQPTIGTRMFPVAGIRFFIEFSSILVLAFLCIMHEFTDVTWAKQFHFDHASANHQHQQHLEDVEQVSVVSSKSPSSNHGIHDYHNHHQQQPNVETFVRFTPKSLNFGHHSIGMPIIKTVHVHNDDDENDLQLISISGNTEHFHCSFFEDKILPPRSNTSFQVAFLARQEGLVNNTLYIHSSAGTFQYHVSAFGEISPFRVRPLIGARVPLNSSFASLIYIYNPFSTPLQLTEMYTSGGGLHLELLNDDFEAPSNAWEVPPFETRPVMRAHFVARIASNHTSYIRIRTNQPEIQLMLPVEVEVSDSPGLYSPLETLDFGVLRAKHDPPKTLPIQVINAAQKSVSVQSIVVTPISDGLTVIDFSGPVKLPPQSTNPFHVGKLVVDPSQFTCSGLCLGKVLIKSKNNQYKLMIPFIVRVIQGELHFNYSQFHFFMNQSSNNSEQRVLNVENRFDSPIIVHDIVLPDEAKPYFHLTTKPPYSLPVTLPVGQKFPLLKIEFTPSPQLSHFSTVFRLLTNISYFDLPLYAYQGRLDLFIPNSSDQSKLDMGLIGLNQQKTSTFLVANHNPIAIPLVYWHCSITGISVQFVGTSQGNISAISQRIEASIKESSSGEELRLLEPNHVAIFRVHADKLSKEGLYNGIISILTEYEKLLVPLAIKVLSGNLQAEQLILPKTFPGKIVKATLNIRSNYSNNIKIKGAFIEPKDDRFKIKLIDQLIKPGQDNQLLITFDSSAACFQKLCYTALDVEKEVGHLWLLGSGLYSDTAYIDKELYKLLRNQWLMMSEADRNPMVNVKLLIDGFGSFVTPIQAQQHWPRLANKLIIRFPSIRVGQKMTKELLIENSADRQVLVQAINVIDYPNSEVLLQLTSNNIFHQQWSKGDLLAIQLAIKSGHNRSVFSLQNNTIASNSQVQRITEWLGVEPNANSYIMLLPPGVRHRLAVTFNPMDEKNYTSLLILRNNLTIIDVVMLRGEGGRGLLKIGKVLPNSPNSRLVFDFPERTLERRCKSLAMEKAGLPAKTNQNGKPQSSTMGNNFNTLVMRERFKAVNIGRMELQIRKFLIDGMPCEGHGFRITRCEPILLQPNQTFDIEILYSPDFTQHSIIHELTIMIDDESLSAQKFLLVANIPPNLLNTCLEAIPRPVWEPHLYYILVMMAFFVLILSMIVAVFDGHRITLNYYNSKYEFLNNNHHKRHDEEDDGGGTGGGGGGGGGVCNMDSNGHVGNGCKCIHQETSTYGSGKKLLNGTATSSLTNGTMVNGKHNYSVNNVSTKLRNRRGANNKQNSVGNNQQQQQQQQQVNQKKHMKTASSSDISFKSNHNHHNSNNGSKSNGLVNYPMDGGNNEYYSPPYSWNQLVQSSEFIRQDSSSSSEHSNRSPDLVSKTATTKNANENTKKSSNDSLNETTAAAASSVSNNNSGNNSPSSNRPPQSARKTKSPPIVVGGSNFPTEQSSTIMKNVDGGGGLVGSSLSNKIPPVKNKSAVQNQTKSVKQTKNDPAIISSNSNGNSKKEKGSKFNLNDSVAVLESLKSSSESLATMNKYDMAFDHTSGNNGKSEDDFVPKTRSATLPLSLNNHDDLNLMKNCGIVDGGFYVSDSNISSSCLESSCSTSNRNNSFSNQDQRMANNNKMDTFQADGGGRMNFMQNNRKPSPTIEYFEYFETNNIHNSNNNNVVNSDNGHSIPKDIWDLPITRFDTDLAMSELVKQTEEAFDDIGNKTQSVIGFKRGCLSNTIGGGSTNNHHQNRRHERNINSAKFNSTVDDKWEIGEWSNDILLDRNSSSSTNNNKNDSSKHFCNPTSGNNMNFGNYESVGQMKKYRYSPSTTVNYQEYRNSLNDNNNSSRFLKSPKMFSMNNDLSQQPKPISPPLTSSFGAASTTNSHQSNSLMFNNNSSLSSALNVSPVSNVTSLSTTTASSMIGSGGTFSPVVERPLTSQQQIQQPTSSIHEQRSKLVAQTDAQQQQHRHGSMKNRTSFDHHFDENFAQMNNSKSLSLDLPTFNNPTELNSKALLDSLLEKSAPSAFHNPTPNSIGNDGLSLSNNNSVGNNTNMLASLLQSSEPWDPNPINEFPLASFLSSSNCNNHARHQDASMISKPTISSPSTSSCTNQSVGMFNMVGNDNVVGSASSLWSQSPSTTLWPTSNPLSNDHSMVVGGSSNNWPMTSSSSSSMALNERQRNLGNSINGNDSTDATGNATRSGSVWPSFDSFNYSSSFAASNTNTGKMTDLNSSTAATASSSSISVVNNNRSTGSFGLFGSNPWSPLGSTPPNSNGGNELSTPTINSVAGESGGGLSPVANFLTPSSNTAVGATATAAAAVDSLFGRFSHNSSPSSTSSCGGGGAGAVAGNGTSSSTNG